MAPPSTHTTPKRQREQRNPHSFATLVWTMMMASLLSSLAIRVGVVGTAFAGEATGPVMPCVFEPQAAGPQAEAATRIYAATQKQARYLLGQLRPWSEDAEMLLLTESRSGEHWIYEKGRRTITLDGKATEVPALSGQTILGGGVRTVAVDSALLITSAEPLSVSYRGAAAPDRARATDQLVLNWHGVPKRWKAGEVISEWEAAVRCVGDF